MKKTAEELEKLFDISPERIAQIDEDASRGVLPGEAGPVVTGPGRPPLFEEPMRQVTFKETDAKLSAMDERARQLGLSRSEYLRQLVDNDLSCVGMA